jgi:HEAT repeat protein
MIQMNVDKEIDYLIGYQSRNHSKTEHVIPEYLIPGYSRLAAIANLVALEKPTMKVIAALLRVGVLDEEEDVRREALLGLVKINPDIAKAALVAGTYDADYQVRATAIEELHRIAPNLAIETAKRLKDDEDEMVRDYATELLRLSYTKSHQISSIGGR